MTPQVERVLGGAGTGKTTVLERRLTEFKDAGSLEPDQLACCTFTRAGRQEISERVGAAWGCGADYLTNHGWFRTAHSIAYKQTAVEDGQLLQGSDGMAWIGEAIGSSVSTRFDARSNAVSYLSNSGDPTPALALKAWDLARAKNTSLSAIIATWAEIGEPHPDYSEAETIIKRFEDRKRREGRLDFTDMIARFAGIRFTIEGPVECEPEGEVPPGIKILAIDEAQDSSLLVDRVCRRLAFGGGVEHVMLMGDPYQSIFGFGGSDYRHFLSWDAAETIMPQSYRCPPKVMALGEQCLRMMRTGYRDRGIKPASHDGSVSTVWSIDEALSMVDHTETTMILGRCGFNLEEYEARLKGQGMPYSWIDRVGSENQLSAYMAFWSLAHGEPILGRDWANAIEVIVANSKVLGKLIIHGEKKAWKEGKRANLDILRPIQSDLQTAGCTEVLSEMLLKGKWLDVLDSKVRPKAEQWSLAAARFGPEVASDPKVRLSTIHSAKGCEADTVILSRSSSQSVTRSALALEDSHDEECRVNYVGVTRARRRLLVVEDGGWHKLDLPI